jgi:S-adenosylmethionine/arginine decarboxylase-like enzyme
MTQPEMQHFTLDGFRGFRSRMDDVHLVQELLEEIPLDIDVQPVMPAFLMPYYNGVDPEDCGISGFVFLQGGHLTLHTFSYREVYFADLVYGCDFATDKLQRNLDTALPCESTESAMVKVWQDKPEDKPVDPDQDFGPHVMMAMEGYKGPSDLGGLFKLFDKLPSMIGMTPIMRPYVIENVDGDGGPCLSALIMIAESHLAIHVFPEAGYAYFDIFSCKFFDVDSVMSKIGSVLAADSYKTWYKSRGKNYMSRRTQRAVEAVRKRTWQINLEAKV